MTLVPQIGLPSQSDKSGYGHSAPRSELSSSHQRIHHDRRSDSVQHLHQSHCNRHRCQCSSQWSHSGYTEGERINDPQHGKTKSYHTKSNRGDIIEYTIMDIPCFDPNCNHKNITINYPEKYLHRCESCDCNWKSAFPKPIVEKPSNDSQPAITQPQYPPGTLTTTTTYTTVTYPSRMIAAVPYLIPMVGQIGRGNVMMTQQPQLQTMSPKINRQGETELLLGGGTIHTLGGIPVLVPLGEKPKTFMM